MNADPDNTWPSIPGYTIIEMAGSGGMSVVYRGREDGTGRQVAIRMLTDRGNPERQAHFKREAQIIAALEHPHILPIYNFGIHQSRPYMITRYMEGGTVADHIKAGPLPPEKAVEWLIQIAEAVDLAHTKGLVHRDLKPSNLLLDLSQNVYLADFGMADAVGEDGVIKGGSAAYMSPEQGRGETNLTPATDVYSLCVTLFEMLTAVKPFLGESILATLVKHIEAPIPSIRDLNAGLSFALDDVIRWGMAKIPEERPTNGGELAAALRAALSEPDMPVARPARDDRDLPVFVSWEERQSQMAAETPPMAVPEAAPWPAWILLLAIGVLSAGVFFLWERWRPTSEVPTPVPEGAVLALPTSVSTPAGQIYFDDFGSNSTAGDELDEASLVDGQLQLATNDARFRIFWVGEAPPWGNGRIEIDLSPVLLTETFEIGLLCRFQDPENFVGAVWIDAEPARLEVWEVSDGLITRRDAAPLAESERGALRQGTTLFLLCDGARFEAGLRGTLLLTLEPLVDQKEGRAAVMIRPLVDGPLQLRFDNLHISAP